MRRWLLFCLLWCPLTTPAASVLEHGFELRVEGKLARHRERLVVLLGEPADSHGNATASASTST
jgi:hypothetical protein